MHRFKFTAAGLRCLGQLDQTSWTARDDDGRTCFFDVLPLPVEDLRRNIGIIHVKGTRPAAAPVGLLHLDEFSGPFEKVARLVLDPLAPHEMAGVVIGENGLYFLPW